MAISRVIPFLMVIVAIGSVHCAPEEKEEPPPADHQRQDLLSIIALKNQQSEDLAVSHLLRACYAIHVSGLTPSEAIVKVNSDLTLEDNAFAQETIASLTRNLENLSVLGCLSRDGLESLKKGSAPEFRDQDGIRRPIVVLRIVSKSKVPDLANQIFNLEISSNVTLNETPAERQLEFARRWHWQELISDRDYAAVVYGFPSQNSRK